MLNTALARNSDPSTSHEAAGRVNEFAEGQKIRIMAALKFGALGAEQIAAQSGLAPYEVRKRLSDLQKLTLAQPTGDTRRTSSGRSERVWRLVPAQMELI